MSRQVPGLAGAGRNVLRGERRAAGANRRVAQGLVASRLRGWPSGGKARRGQEASKNKIHSHTEDKHMGLAGRCIVAIALTLLPPLVLAGAAATADLSITNTAMHTP